MKITRDMIGDLYASRVGGSVCRHRQIRRDGSIVLSLAEYDDKNVICKYCGKILSKASAFEYDYYLKNLT
nr:MAG TPA: CHC2 zinc finger protein [Caudoviricetes sp.]